MSEAVAEQIALDFIKKWEGCSLTAYWDMIGQVWTIGYGHTKGVTKNMTCDQAQADKWLAEDVAWAVTNVKDFVNVVLNQNQFAALISFEFNTGAAATSGVFVNINENNFPAALDILMDWVHDGNGNVIPGLVNRRTAEKALFLTP